MTQTKTTHVRRFRLLMATLVVLVSFVSGEMLLRIFKPQATYSYFMKAMGEQYRQGDFIPFALKASYTGITPSQETYGKTVAVTINEFGLRGKSINLAKPAGVKRVLILGDSYTFGVYVADDEAYPAVLEALYKNDGATVEVLNAGYADGWSPDEHYAWLVHKAEKFQPDVIIYGFFVGNDIHWINREGWGNLDERGLPTTITNPNIYVDNVGRIRSKIKDDRTVGYAHNLLDKIPLLRESHLLIFLNDACFTSILFPFFKIEEVTTFPFVKITNSYPMLLEDVSLRVEQQNIVDRFIGQKEELFRRLVWGMSDWSSEHNAKFMLLMIPINFQVHYRHALAIPKGFRRKSADYFKELTPWLDENSIAHINLLDEMRQFPEERYYPANGEVHFNPNGHAFTAKLLKERLDQLGWLQR